MGICSSIRRRIKYYTAKSDSPLRRAGRSEGAARAGDRRGPGAAPAAQGAGGQRHRQPEAGRDAAQPADGRATRSSTPTPARPCSWPTRRARRGDTAKAAEYSAAAEALRQPADRDGDTRSTSTKTHGPAVHPGRRAGQGGRRPERRRRCRHKLAERQKLLSQLDQAKMQEQMNTAMASLSARPSARTSRRFDEVRDKIEARYAKAKGMAELSTGQRSSDRMLEIEQAVDEQRGPGPADRDPHAAGPRRRRGRRPGAARASGCRQRRGAGQRRHPPATAAAGRTGQARSSRRDPPARPRRHLAAKQSDRGARSAQVGTRPVRGARPGRRGGRPTRAPSGRSVLRRPATALQAAGVEAAEALGEHDAVGAGHLDGVVGVERRRRRRSRRRAAASVPPRSSARRAPSSTMTVPLRPDGEGDPQLAGRQPAVAGQHDGADAGRAGHGVGEHVGPVGAGDHGPHPGPRRDLGRGDLGGHAAAAPGRCRRPRPRPRARGRPRRSPR